jgi:predicted  nucleic acid-binding Zn-ribbon protein
MSIKEQIDILLKLQKIEIEAEAIKAELEAVDKRLEALDGQLEEFEKSIAAEETAVDELKKTYREYESNAQLNVARSQKTQEKLRSVKTNREYQSLLKEIEEGKTRTSEIEDQMLDCLDRLDELEKEIAAKKEAYTELCERIRIEKEEIMHETEEGRERLAKLDSDRETVSATIAPELLEKYNSIRVQRGGGLALAPVKNAICYGCNVGFPPQLYNELHRFDEVKFCPHCQRIIYFENSE